MHNVILHNWRPSKVFLSVWTSPDSCAFLSAQIFSSRHTAASDMAEERVHSSHASTFLHKMNHDIQWETKEKSVAQQRILAVGTRIPHNTVTGLQQGMPTAQSLKLPPCGHSASCLAVVAGSSLWKNVPVMLQTMAVSNCLWERKQTEHHSFIINVKFYFAHYHFWSPRCQNLNSSAYYHSDIQLHPQTSKYISNRSEPKKVCSN